jgi:putative flavoprotein involved in K+ transport
MERIDTVIVGGGQAGLSTSYHLKQQGQEHVVLEQAAKAGNVWRNERWDSFTLVIPNWAVRLPGAEYDGPDRNGFMPKEEIVSMFERYAERFALPVRYNTRVLAIEPVDGGGYKIETNSGTIMANNVVIATGMEQLPKIPAFAETLSSDITQMHSSKYRNPQSLPEGAVLVVGSAQSGAQIAEELQQSGRKVYLSTSRAGRAPRRYRGKDTLEWLFMLGFFDTPAEKMPFPAEHFTVPHVSGTRGGHTLNLHQFARDGMTLLGHVRGIDGYKVTLAPDLYQNLGMADGFAANMQKMVDGFIAGSGIDAPTEELPQRHDGFQQPVIEELDLKAAGISTVIWATGYRFDYSLVKLPVFDERGIPVQDRGATAFPGLYFVGLPWTPALRSATLAGVGDAARHIASNIVARAAVPSANL